jgi:TRAP-type C4-dicarboxylate transport system substrate-binding protein
MPAWLIPLLPLLAKAGGMLLDYFESLPEKERQAVKDALDAMAKSSSQDVGDFVTGSAADLADAQARLAALEAHPVVVASGLAATVATLRNELAERAKPL